jgi:hypothetical protein
MSLSRLATVELQLILFPWHRCAPGATVQTLSRFAGLGELRLQARWRKDVEIITNAMTAALAQRASLHTLKLH